MVKLTEYDACQDILRYDRLHNATYVGLPTRMPRRFIMVPTPTMWIASLLMVYSGQAAETGGDLKSSSVCLNKAKGCQGLLGNSTLVDFTHKL